jgi:hypothetical protein
LGGDPVGPTQQVLLGQLRKAELFGSL